jgi:hypothetical protein
VDAAEAGSHRVKAGENRSGNLRLPNNCHRDDEDHFIRVKLLEGEVTLITVALREPTLDGGEKHPILFAGQVHRDAGSAKTAKR